MVKLDNRLYLWIVNLFLLLVVLLPIPVDAPVQRAGMPRLDQITAIVESDPDIAWQMFLDGEADFYPDIIPYEHVEEAQSLGHSTWNMPGFDICYMGINCRDYVPDDAGQPDAGRPLAPLNWTGFRLALTWSSLSMAQKEVAINDIYGPGLYVPAYTIVPEALGVWHNPNVTSLGGNYTEAWEALKSAGFNIADNLLYQPNGFLVREEIQLINCGAPTTIQFGDRYCIQWNDFFDNFLNVTNCNIIQEYVDYSILVDRAFNYRNFDMYWLGWGLSRFPDYICDFFHSSQDFPWGYNPGINNTQLDHYIETVKWGLDYEQALQACWEAEKLLVEELVPYVHCYHKNYWTITRDTLANEINMNGVGADNHWTWNLMHWDTNLTGGNVNYVLGDSPNNLHPGWAYSAYEKWLLDRINDGLTAVTPDLRDMPWVACSWNLTPFESSLLNIENGTKITFRIRDNVYWQDGWPVTAQDIKFNWEFMTNFAEFYHIYDYSSWIDIDDDPYTVTAYLDTVDPFLIYDYAEVALLFPKHVYNPDYHPTRDPVNDRVDQISWEDWMTDYTGPVPEEVVGWSPGDPPPTGIPPYALVGCGPYYFHNYNISTGTAVLKKNPYYWVENPVSCGFDVPGRIDPQANHFGHYVICNQGAKNQTTGELSPVHIHSIDIYINDEYIATTNLDISIDPFQCEMFAADPTLFNLPFGIHEVCIKVYEAGDPVNPITECCKKIYVTLREDLNLDIHVGIDDIVRCTEAFGSSPLHTQFPSDYRRDERWDERCDLNDDYYIGIDDIVNIAEDFGSGT